MPIHAEAANRSTTVDREKWLRTFQGWAPSTPLEEHVAFINWWIEVAGPRRVEWIDAYIKQADNQQRRTGAWKMKRLKDRAEDMAKNPERMPWLRKLRGSPDFDVVLKTLKAAGRGLRAREIMRAFPRHRAITLGALNNVLLGMVGNGLIERYSDGIYGVPRSEGERYESIPRRIFKLVLAVPETTRGALIRATGCSSGSVSGVIDNLRKRGLIDPSVVAVSAEARAKAERGETIFNKKGKVFWAPDVPSSDAQRVDAAVFTTLRPERPRVDREAREQKLAWLRTLKGEQLKSAVAITANELACDPGDLVERLPKSAQRYLRNETARERWREKLTRMMEESPKRSPKPLPDLFKDAHEAGVSRRVCKDVIREVTAVLRQKGLETSWSDPGAPKRG